MIASTAKPPFHVPINVMIPQLLLFIAMVSTRTIRGAVTRRSRKVVKVFITYN